MPTLTSTTTVQGPWSLATCREFWEGFTPSKLSQGGADEMLRAAFRVEADWSTCETVVRQEGPDAWISVTGEGDVEAATAQVRRFLALDIDARGWPDVGKRDPVIGRIQAALPGLRPCGFHSPYEAAAWSVLSQRIGIVQAARLRRMLIAEHGEGGAFPAPATLRSAEIDLPGRKLEYLHAVADAALDGVLDGAALRAIPPEEAVERVQAIKGMGPFSAELVVLRGANAPDMLPTRERRIQAEVDEQYGQPMAEVSEAWRPFRTWAVFHLRVARERRTHEVTGHRRSMRP